MLYNSFHCQNRHLFNMCTFIMSMALPLNKCSLVYYLTELFRLLDIRPLLQGELFANAHSKMGWGGGG